MIPLAIFAAFARDIILSRIGTYAIRLELSGNRFHLLRVSNADSTQIINRKSSIINPEGYEIRSFSRLFALPQVPIPPTILSAKLSVTAWEVER